MSVCVCVETQFSWISKNEIYVQKKSIDIEQKLSPTDKYLPNINA